METTGRVTRFRGRLSSSLPWVVAVTDADGAEVARGAGTSTTIDWTWNAAAATPVAVIENASRHDRRAYAGRLDELARIAARPELTGPVLIIIGEVVAAGAIGVEPVALAELAA